MKKVSFIFAWFDLWVGLYWDKEKRRLYFLPFPTIGLVFHFKEKESTVRLGDRRVRIMCNNGDVIEKNGNVFQFTEFPDYYFMLHKGIEEHTGFYVVSEYRTGAEIASSVLGYEEAKGFALTALNNNRDKLASKVEKVAREIKEHGVKLPLNS